MSEEQVKTLKKHPKVFISYSHDSPPHSARVLAFARALRSNGIDVELDQFHQDEILDWPRWCNEQTSRDCSDFILCVCTAEYYRRIEGKVPPERGKGVYWEGSLLDDEIYDLKGNRRILPILLDNEPESSIPRPLRGWTFCRIGMFELNDAGYEKILRIITGQVRVTLNPLGDVPVLPPESKPDTIADQKGAGNEIVEPKAKKRRIDAVTPSSAEVGQELELLIQVRFISSPRLGPKDWPVDEQPHSVKQAESKIVLDFPVDAQTGKTGSAKLMVKIIAPAFDIQGSPERRFDVPPDHYSQLISILLIAKQPGKCRINVEVYTVDDRQLGTIPLLTTVGGTKTPQPSIAHLFLLVDVGEEKNDNVPLESAAPKTESPSLPEIIKPANLNPPVLKQEGTPRRIKIIGNSNIMIGSSGNINVGSSFNNISRVIGASNLLAAAQREELEKLVTAFQRELEAIKPSHEAETMDIARRLEEVVNCATRPEEKNHKVWLKLSSAALIEAAATVAKIAPGLLLTGRLIAELLVDGLATPKSKSFDVFLSHNSKDKTVVRELKRRLVARNLAVWLDEDELRPGIPWQELLESGIRSSASVAVLVGNDGLGPWEDEEMQGALRLAIKDKRPIIPVILPKAQKRPELPLFLGNRTWVDLRGGFKAEGFSKLVWGITGKKP